MTLTEALDRYPGAQVFRFGDGPVLCNALLALVRAGKKTATCGARRDFADGSPEMPLGGRRDIATTWEGHPSVATETVEVTIRRFCDMDADFALAEGEDATLEGWRQSHAAYFARNGGFDPEMELVCERFRVVEIFEGQADV